MSDMLGLPQHTSRDAQVLAAPPLAAPLPAPFATPPSKDPSPTLDPSHLRVDFSDGNTYLGAGTYGSVYRGVYKGADVAVKRLLIDALSPQVANDPFVKAQRAAALHAFAAEVHGKLSLSHVGVVRTLGAAPCADDAVLIVSEFMRGGSLGAALDALRRVAVPMELASLVRIARQACVGMIAVHAAGCAWGEVKPENVLLTARVGGDGRWPHGAKARISDFGLAGSVSLRTLTESTISASGQTLGTVNYMAPESAAEAEDGVGMKTDVFSFGMVLFEMLTLRKPWKRKSLMQVYSLLAQGKRPEWPKEGDDDFRGHVPDALRDVVERCWAQEVDERPTATVLLGLLEECARGIFGQGDEVNAASVPEDDTEGSLAYDAKSEIEPVGVSMTSQVEARELENVIQEVDETRLDDASTDQLLQPGANVAALAAPSVVQHSQAGASHTDHVPTGDNVSNLSNNNLRQPVSNEKADTAGMSAQHFHSSVSSMSSEPLNRFERVGEKGSEMIMKRERTAPAQHEIPPMHQKDRHDPATSESPSAEAERAVLHAMERAQVAGDTSYILQAMKDHYRSMQITKTGMLYIQEQCKHELTYFDICEEGGIEVLLSATVRYAEFDKDICVSFCDSITILSEHYNDKVGHRVRAAGVPSEVVELMNMHKIHVPTQIAGCKCLAAIAGASELSRSAVATLGGPAVVYSAMTKNNVTFKDIDLARASLLAVRQIAQNNERASEFLVQVSALDAVSRSAAVFTDHGLEVDILAALRAFSFYTGGRRNIVLSSGLKALADIMLRNEDPDFLVLCCQFIRAIAQWRNVECEQAMLQSCIAERVTTLMQNSNYWPGEPGAKVSWYACQACLFLASFGSLSRKRLRQVGAIETTISILNQRRENSRVARCATDALAELLKGEPEAKIYAERSHAVEALKMTLELHGNDVKVRSAVQWTLDCLSSGQGPISAPAQDSQMHEELTDFATGSLKPKAKLLGFNFFRKKLRTPGYQQM